MKRFAHYHLPALAYAAAIFALSSVPQLATPDWGFDYADKIAHFIEYLGLAVLVRRAFGNLAPVGSPAKVDMWTGLACIAFAALDEYHQSFVPGRMADLTDLLADAGGVMSGIIIGRLAGRRKRVVSATGDRH